MGDRITRAVRVTRSSALATGGGLLLFAAMSTVNAANFVFHVVISRILGPADYGALGALLGVVLVLQVPVGAVQVAITQEVAARRLKNPEEKHLLIGGLVANAVIVAIVVTLGVVLASPWLRGFLHLADATAVILLGTVLVPVLVGLVPKGVLLGQLRFRPVAVALVVGAMVRLLAGVFLGEAGKGVSGAMAATVVGELAVALCLIVPVRTTISHQSERPELRIHGRDAARATVAFAGFWLMLGVDTFLARHFLTRVESGLYAAASTASAMVLFFPAAVALIAFPRFAESEGRGPESRRALVHALAIVAALESVAVALILLFPDLLIAVLFGDGYRAASGVLGTLGAAAAVMGLVNVLLHYLLACRSRMTSAVWGAVGAAAWGIWTFHGSLRQIANVMLSIEVVLLLVLLVTAQMKGRRREREVEGVGNLWDLIEPEVDLTIVVPFYNPGPRFRPNIERLVRVLHEEGVRAEVICVSDGSTDGSEETIRGFREDVVTCVVRDRNMGKGSALKTGLGMARGQYVGFIDADGDIEPDLLRPFLALMRLYEPDIILGSKRHPLSEVDYPGLRRVYSWGFQQLIRALFRLNVRDTQTGLKLARRDVLAKALPLMVEKRFAFDLELFVVARHLGYRRFFEAPVTIGERFSSTVSMKSVRATLIDTLAIFYRLRILRFYDRQVEPVGPAPVLVASATSAPN